MRTRIDVYETSRKNLITLSMINNSKHHPWFPSLGISHTKFCCVRTTLYTLDTQKVLFINHQHQYTWELIRKANCQASPQNY